MDSRKIIVFTNKANRRLKLQFWVKLLQIAVSIGLAAALLVFLVSRLSVFPYYGFYAYCAAGLSIIIFCIWNIRHMPRRKQAIAELDEFTPHNQLLTLTQLPADHQFRADLTAKTEKELHLSYQLFKKERNEWFLPKSLLISLGLAVLLLLSGLFPAAAQLEAKEQEQELEIMEEIVEEVQKQKELADSPLVKEQLESLEERLEDSETPEEALRELVKKQKELELQKKEKMDQDSEVAQHEAEELNDASSQLAKQAGKTQTALSEMGKPVAFDLQQALAANELAENLQDSKDSDAESEDGSDDESAPESSSDGEEGNSAGSEGEGTSGSESPEQAGSEEAGVGQGESGSGAAPGEGEGHSEGEGQGQDGEGAGMGTGAGAGQGSRELLTIPSRLGGGADPTLDNGELSEGAEGSFEEGPVNAERGTVRPYQNMVGAYSDSYFSSAQRMKLPPDLQNIVEQYFSAIESD